MARARNERDSSCARRGLWDKCAKRGPVRLRPTFLSPACGDGGPDRLKADPAAGTDCINNARIRRRGHSALTALPRRRAPSH